MQQNKFFIPINIQVKTKLFRDSENIQNLDNLLNSNTKSQREVQIQKIFHLIIFLK